MKKSYINQFIPAIKYFFFFVTGILLSLSAISFTPDRHHPAHTVTFNNVNDSTDSAKGFKSLLSSQIINPLKPWLVGLNPQMGPFLHDYTNLEANEFANMKTWAVPYFKIYDKILSENGLPVELKYLSVIESHLQSDLVSSAGAVGPWQLMPDEAVRFGLRMGGGYDERTDFYKSTEVAAKLLKNMYNEFGDWLLVIAAYNAGEGGVKRAIAKAGSSNFYDLQYYLPAETRNHVKKYIATHFIFEGGGGITTMTAAETKEYQQNLLLQNNINRQNNTDANTLSMEISGKYNSVLIANALLMDITQFNSLNPLLDTKLARGETYQMRLPADKMQVFQLKKQQILRQSVEVLFSSSGK